MTLKPEDIEDGNIDLIRDMVKKADPARTGHCAYCSAVWQIHDDTYTHEPDCLWMRACELVQRKADVA